MKRSIEPFIHRKIIVLREGHTAMQASRAMCENQVGCVMVAGHDGHITGILTDRDLVCNLMAAAISPEVNIRHIMTKDLVYVREGAHIDEVIELMLQFGIRRIPVLGHLEDGRERCIGLVTLDDLIASREIDPDRLSRIVQSQIRTYHRPLDSHDQGGTFRLFIERLADKIGAGAEETVEFAKYTFGTIVRRLHYTAAVQFILQAPRELQDELFRMHAGPDRSIDAEHMITGANAHLHASDREAELALREFWSVLEDFGNRFALEHTLAQLPPDLRTIFAPGFEPYPPKPVEPPVRRPMPPPPEARL